MPHFSNDALPSVVIPLVSPMDVKLVHLWNAASPIVVKLELKLNVVSARQPWKASDPIEIILLNESVITNLAQLQNAVVSITVHDVGICILTKFEQALNTYPGNLVIASFRFKTDVKAVHLSNPPPPKVVIFAKSIVCNFEQLLNSVSNRVFTLINLANSLNETIVAFALNLQFSDATTDACMVVILVPSPQFVAQIYLTASSANLI